MRLMALLAVAHASLAFHVWFCAFELDLVVIPVRLWLLLAWSWAGWPVILVAIGQSLGRHALRPNLAVNRTPIGGRPSANDSSVPVTCLVRRHDV